MQERSWGAEGIVESLPVGVIVVDQAMRIVCLNRAAQEYTGYAPPDVIGSPLSEMFDRELWAEESALQQAMETGKRVEPRATTVMSNASEASGDAPRRDRRRLLVGAAPIEGKRGRAGEYLLSLQPTSPLYQMEADRISDISHDMRGPLASILAYTELLVDEVDEGQPELRRQFLEVIEQRTRHLTDLIVNLTSLVRQDLGYLKMTKRQISLRDVTSAVLQTLQVQARQRDVRLTLEAGDDQHLVVGDRDALSTLLKNLISNAIKFSSVEGKVVVSLRRVGQNQILRVTDSGSGIPTEDLPHIFEAFYRGQNAVAAGIEGSGLGLALVKAIAEAHNGEINVDSKESEGTTITIALPAAEKESPRPS
jgi:signal transduction histidine kinase